MMWSKRVCVWIFGVFFSVIVNSTQGAWLRCYRGSINHYLATPLDKPLMMIATDCLDPALPTVIYTFGYRGRSSGPATTAVLEAYIGTRKRNVILLDWEDEARSGLMGIPLSYVLYAVPNAVKVGKALGGALMKLAGAGLNTTQVHLVGHSLGAHIMANAGRSARENGYIVPRITGLDPARALFEGTLQVQQGLDRTCARFVDIVHSDPGGYGTSLPSGTVDFWPNYAGSGTTQPGCPSGDYEMFTAEDLCSHDRAWRYFVEAIKSPTAFPATPAADVDSWRARRSFDRQTIYLGELASTRAQGNYFLTTNNTAPFSLGYEGLRPDASQVRRRRRSSSLTRLLKYLR